MQRKARAGHVTGGRVFGYDNVTLVGSDGRRSHVERRINDTEATVVRQVFDYCATGYGLKAIAKRLNTDGAPSPRAQRGRSQSWVPSSVREVLHRDRLSAAPPGVRRGHDAARIDDARGLLAAGARRRSGTCPTDRDDAAQRPRHDHADGDAEGMGTDG